jgi:hypothetical protein
MVIEKQRDGVPLVYDYVWCIVHGDFTGVSRDAVHLRQTRPASRVRWANRGVAFARSDSLLLLQTGDPGLPDDDWRDENDQRAHHRDYPFNHSALV